MPDLDRWENEGGSLLPPRRTVHLRALQRRHAQLDDLVQQEMKRPAPCAIELQRLRREKLYLRDQMRTLGT